MAAELCLELCFEDCFEDCFDVGRDGRFLAELLLLSCDVPWKECIYKHSQKPYRVPDLGVEGSLVGPIVSNGCSVLVWTIVEGVERDDALENNKE